MKKLFIMLVMLGSCSLEPTPSAYYLGIKGTGIYVITNLGDSYSKVGELSEWDDPESLREVFETQPGWETGLAASEAYYYLRAD